MEAAPRWKRAAFVRIYEREGALSVLGNDGKLRRFEGASAAFAGALLEALREPRTKGELYAHVAALADEGSDVSAGRAAVDTVLDAFVDAGVVQDANARARRAPDAAGTPRRVVLLLSGGIAAAHAPALVEILLDRGLSLRVAATSKALRFVSALALEALTHERVVAKTWPRDPQSAVPHLDLARWAELVVVYPATATTMSRIARGDCSTVVSAVAISTRAPVVLVPAMNDAMLDAPSVRRNLETLKADGFFVTQPSLGYEVAEEPTERRARAQSGTFGAAPPVAFVADIVESVLSEHTREGSRAGYG